LKNDKSRRSSNSSCKGNAVDLGTREVTLSRRFLSKTNLTHALKDLSIAFELAEESDPENTGEQ
jgi:hypothetical protein